jgi:hypothetical protein
MNPRVRQAIRGMLTLAVAASLVATWSLRNSRKFGEWLRRMSDVPTAWVLTRTSGFEREGRDPAKRD